MIYPLAYSTWGKEEVEAINDKSIDEVSSTEDCEDCKDWK